MLALTWNGQELALDPSYPDPQPGPGEALVQVLLAGICGTDRAITGGYAQFQGVLGHEFVGRVLACMDRPELVGRRAAGEINIGCGRCVRCQAGMRNHCQQRTVIGIRSRDGVFANYVAIPAENLVPVPNGVPDEAAVFTEPLAAALEILEQVLVHPSDRVVVIGDGKLGQLVARVLHLTGCQLVVVGRHRERRSLALLRDVGIRTGLVDDLPDG
ncbi:MAG: alcohol dehydrogenase catalytic domain-containing protein, partial [Anaerolineae bacterium]